MDKDQAGGDRKPRRDLDEHSLKWLTAHQDQVEAARKKLEARAKRLGVRIEDLRDDRQKAAAHAKSRREKERDLEKAIADVRQHDRLHELWTKHACAGTCTTWLGLKLVLVTVAAKTDWTLAVNAADRTEAHVDDCGDHQSQAELYYGFTHGLPGFAPANPPGTGSHEGICDDDLSAAGFGSIGSHLKPWQWGLDLGDGPGFESGADHLGFNVVRVYPNESWHCNVKDDPTAALKKLGVV